MKIIRSKDRSGKRRSAHGEPVEPLQRSEAVELLERLERTDPIPDRSPSCVRSSPLRERLSPARLLISEAVR